MNWFIKTSSNFTVLINGNKTIVDIHELNKIIIDKLKRSRAVISLFKQYNVNIEKLNDLKIEVVDLDGKYGESDINGIRLNSSLFRDSHFFDKYFFVVFHELVHWLSRVKEEKNYFQDPEERLGFLLSIASEIESGQSKHEIWKKIFPKVSFHFNDKNDAANFFQKMYEKAIELLK